MDRGDDDGLRPLLLLDLDGTLVDHDTAEVTGVDGWLSAAGLPHEVDGVPAVRLWREITEAVLPDYFHGRLGLQEQRRIRVRGFLPLLGVDVAAMTDDEVDAHFREYHRRYAAAWTAFPDVVPALTRLRENHRLAVLTNGDQDHQEGKLRTAGVDGLVEQVVATSTLGAAKPEAAAFHRALDRLGADPATTTYVGDRLDVDARGAQAAGLVGVWLDRVGDGPPPDDVRTIRSLADLP